MKLLSVCLVAACAEPTIDPPTRLGSCDGVIAEPPVVDSIHVPFGSPVEWPTNPPTSGTHWAVWAQWDRAYVELPRGLWLHNAEHGGGVLASRCVDCEAFDALVELARKRPIDPHCAPPLRHRLVVTSDPLLPDGVEVAAITWGAAYTASCLDPNALGDFLDMHYGRATENTCADGVELDGVPLRE